MKSNRIQFLALIILSFFQLTHIQSEPILKKNVKKKDLIRFANDPKESEILFSGADEGEYIKVADHKDGIIVLKGNIKMRSNGKTIYARKVVYNIATGDVTLTEDVIFEDGKNRIKAYKCIYNKNEKAGVIYNAESNDKPFFFETDKIRIVNEKTYLTEDSDITTCDLEKPHYHFLSDKIWIYNDGSVITYNAVYFVGDIPIFYFPVIVHTDEGSGIITQFGESDRRGTYMQNTVIYKFPNGNRWKYKLDTYEKLGYYGGIEYSKKSRDLDLSFYLGGAKYKQVDEDFNVIPISPDDNDNWFKTDLKTRLYFNRRSGSYSYCDLRLEWMNDDDFEKRFDNRLEPRKTFEMFRTLPSVEIAAKEKLIWNYTIGDRGANHSMSLSFQRTWRWEETAQLDEIDEYALKGRYMPYEDLIPTFSFTYSGSFNLFDYTSRIFRSEKEPSGEDNINTQKHQKTQQFKWEANLTGKSTKNYEVGEHLKTTYKPQGYFKLYTDFPFLTLFTYTPGIKWGFVAERVDDPNDDTRETNEIVADKNTFQYIETSNALKFGSSSYYLNITHYYRRSYLERDVIEPFIHEKLNYFNGGIYLYPISEINMSITTRYDARAKLPFENERLKNIEVNNSLFLDFYSYLNNKSTSSKGKGLYYAGITLSNRYTYITKDERSGYNNLDLLFTTGNFSLPGIELIESMNFGYNFYHDFRFPFRDIMSIKWSLNANLTRLCQIEIGGSSQADRAYLYYNENNYNPIDDIEKSLYFYDREKSENAVFTLRNLFINIHYDLHCWKLGLFYDVKRQIENYGPNDKDRLIYYEQSIFLTMSLKAFAGIGFEKTQVYPIGTMKGKQYY